MGGAEVDSPTIIAPTSGRGQSGSPVSSPGMPVRMSVSRLHEELSLPPVQYMAIFIKRGA